MKTLTVGIGCRLHTSAEQIEVAVRAALGSHAFDEIRTIASVDIKTDEAGLLEFCAHHALPLKLFSREQIATIRMDDRSAAVREHLGIDGVCEPCALLGAAAESDVASTPATAHASASVASVVSIASTTPNAPTARLLVRKTLHDGVTVAIASSTAHPAREQTNNQDLP